MCGIGGCVNYRALNTKKPLGEEILNLLYHRGPNEQNTLTHKNTLLAHTRLSIQDSKNGSQPFCIDGYILIFNGEIYNHIEIRKKYLSNIIFKTLSDSETLLYLYKAYKEKMFDFIDGMFSFAILDKKENNIFFGVDRAGKKPFYYYKKNKIFFFASELNVISKIIDLQINESEVSTYLRCGYFYKENTIYKDVYKLNAGCFAKLDLSTMDLKIDRYFDILDLYKHSSLHKDMTFNEAKSITKKALQKSVQNRLISSDLEVGAFLSGGIDSGLVVAMSSEVLNKPIKTFSVAFEDSHSFDESYLASLVAKKYNTTHTKISIKIDNLSQNIDNILSMYGEPFFDSSAIPSFYVAKEAKKYVNVVLNGDGADELFGGYRRYVATKYNNIFKPFSKIASILKPPSNKQNIYSHIYRALNLSTKRDLDFYLSGTTDIFEDLIKFKNNTLNNFETNVRSLNNSSLDNISKMLYLDFSNLLNNDLLKKIDISTMCQALESRSPFLSKYMLEVAVKIPSKYKIKNLTTKYILREIAKEYLPKELINQPKRGFEVPLVKWVDNELKENIFDSLDNGYHQKFVEKSFVEKLKENKLSISKQKRANILWSLFCLNTWYKNIKCQ